MTQTYHFLPAEGPMLMSAAGIDAFLSEAFSAGTVWLAVPSERLGPDFFDLSTRLLGETAQKFRNYNVGLVVVGDISTHEQCSAAFRDFLRETNEGNAFWFVRDEHELREKLVERT